MFGRARIRLTIAACVLATPAAAQTAAPTTTAFDGAYQGVSNEVSTYTAGRRCPQPRVAVPNPLTITNGVLRTSGERPWVGTVSPQGVAVIRCPDAARIDAQIDPQGTIRGLFSGAGGSNTCPWTFVWQKATTSTTAFDGK